ncbi:hypothetical protein M434DRAFT_35435 [Hypoxylon sp. CO27-5]|nr:hypothetical protein M434DRAFT_35435 [Hypoxylon sp. CO27-5]
MQTKVLPLLFLLGAAAPTLGSPITPAAAPEPSAPPAANALDDDVHVQCPDENSENSYDTCLSRNADQQCSSGDLPEQAACQVLWDGDENHTSKYLLQASQAFAPTISVSVDS